MSLVLNNIYSKSNSNSIANYTVGSESGRILIIVLGMSYADDNPTNFVRYGGVNLTKAIDQISADDGSGYHYVRSEIWYMLDPPTGTATVVVNSGDNGEMPIIITYVSNADSSGVGSTTGSGGANSKPASTTLTPSASGSMIIGAIKTGTSGSSVYTALSGTSIEKQQTNVDGTVALLTAIPSGTSPQTIGVSYGTNADWAVVAVEIKVPGVATTNYGLLGMF